MKPNTSKSIHRGSLAKATLFTAVTLLLPHMTTAQTALVLSQSQCREMALAHNEALQKADNDLRKGRA